MTNYHYIFPGKSTFSHVEQYYLIHKAWYQILDLPPTIVLIQLLKFYLQKGLSN